jgi:predicted DNA-binding protein (MmcQ/YjbR family)
MKPKMTSKVRVTFSERTEDSRLTRLSEICAALPEADRECRGDHAAFRVRKKTFAYFLNNHHGDGIVAVTCKVPPGANAALVKAKPAKFYIPPYLGPRGWVALRVDTPEVDWDEVTRLVFGSYQLTAPKRLGDRVP